MIRRPPRSTLFSLHDALPISAAMAAAESPVDTGLPRTSVTATGFPAALAFLMQAASLNTHFTAFVILLSVVRSEEHTSELQSRLHLVCRLLLEKKKTITVVI